MKSRNYSISFFKYLASLLVIAIHCDLFSDVSGVLYFGFTQVLTKMGVPFFAICTGFYAAGHLVSEGDNNQSLKNYSVKHWKKWALTYVIWSFLYMLYSVPKWIETGWFSAWAFVDYIIAAVRNNSYFHLWYMLALLYAWPLFYLCLRYVRNSMWMPLSVLLYCCKAFSYGYYRFMPESIQTIMDYCELYSGLTNGLFMLLPLLLAGAYLRLKPFPRKNVCRIGWLIAIACYAIEASFLVRAGQNRVSFIFFTYVAAVFLFPLIAQSKCLISRENAILLGAASPFIYYSHPMLIETMARIKPRTTVTFLATAFICTVLGIIVSMEKRRLKRKRSPESA